MKVAILTPFYRQATVGNAVTARRLEIHLGKLGCVTELFSLDTLPPDSLKTAVTGFSPDIIHAFHGIRCGALAAEISTETRIPYIITMTGTDLYRGDATTVTNKERAQIGNAAALVVFHEVIAHRVVAAFPEHARRVHIIPQGVAVPADGSADILPESPFVFLLPAGIRPVKNILSSFRLLEQLWRKYPQIRLLLAGPVLDKGYSEEVMEALARYPFAAWLGEIPHAAMPALYRSAHVVLNTSLSEGGMANSILEAMAYSRPVLVSAVEGNCSLVSDGENGFLYVDTADFLRKAERLLLDEGLRRVIGAHGREYVAAHCSPDLEAHRYLELYESCVKSRSLY